MLIYFKEQVTFTNRLIFSVAEHHSRLTLHLSSNSNLYWADWNRKAPKIETSYMDGSNRRVLVRDNLGLPNGLTYDPHSSQLCWADAGRFQTDDSSVKRCLLCASSTNYSLSPAGTHKMECMDPGRGSRSTVLERIQYPFGMTAFGKNIYYTDWQRFDFYFKNLFSNSAFLNREKKKYIYISYSWSLFINETHWCCSTEDTGFLLSPVIQCVKAEEREGRLKVKKLPTLNPLYILCGRAQTLPHSKLWSFLHMCPAL